MRSTVKLLGVAACCATMGVATADADPVPLAEAELDRVVAGSCSGIPGCVDPPLGGIFQPGLPRGPFYGLNPFPPVTPHPNGPQPTDPPGCETVACNPGPGRLPGLEPVTPIAFPPLGPLQPIVWPSLEVYWNPAGMPGVGGSPAG